MISPERLFRPSFFAVYSIASKKALLPVRRRLAGADPREPLRILELVTEGEVIDARVDQGVVLGEHPLRHRHRLDADEAADLARSARTKGSHCRRPWMGSSRSTSSK